MEIVDLEGAREFSAAHHAQSLTRMALCRVQAGADRQPLPPDSWPSG